MSAFGRKLTTPLHFPVSVSVHASAVELVIFGPCFSPEPILQGRNFKHLQNVTAHCQAYHTNTISYLV